MCIFNKLAIYTNNKKRSVRKMQTERSDKDGRQTSCFVCMNVTQTV
jgi:hypothetical protein